MTRKKPALYLSLFALVLATRLGLKVSSYLGVSPVAWARDGAPHRLEGDRAPHHVEGDRAVEDSLLIQFEPPLDQGTPTQGTASGTTRGKCLQDADTVKPLTLLLPASKKGLTISDRPTLYAYIPQTQAKQAEFLLYNQTQKQETYSTKFRLDGSSGIISIQLPADKPALEPGNIYQWRFVLTCVPGDLSADIYKIGWIERTTPNPAIAKSLETATPLDQARIYAKNGFWYDAVTALAKQRQSSGDNSSLETVWKQLLQSDAVKLDAIASEPLIECCQPRSKPTGN